MYTFLNPARAMLVCQRCCSGVFVLCCGFGEQAVKMLAWEGYIKQRVEDSRKNEASETLDGTTRHNTAPYEMLHGTVHGTIQ